MFLKKVLENNKKLVEYAFILEQNGQILPDTYVLDYDMIMQNAKRMLEVAKPLDIKLYFMLKQIGRNPLIAKGLMEVGFDGVVAVDYKETLVMIDNDIKLGNIGHLVQVPEKCLYKVLKAKPEVMTVYSYEKIDSINRIAKELNIIQPLLIRINDDSSKLYSGQVGGFMLKNLKEVIDYIAKLDNVKLGGLTVFPALLFDGEAIKPTANYEVLKKAKAITDELGYHDILINIPSATCVNSIPLIKELGGNNGEPGHGLTGTTPLHAKSDEVEKVAYVYVSEVSHNYGDKSYCYGGGHYRRGHMENALVGKNLDNAKMVEISAPSEESIDYHLELAENTNVGDTVIVCARTQVFTTRSHVAVVKGLSIDNPQIVGIYNPWGEKVEVNWQ